MSLRQSLAMAEADVDRDSTVEIHCSDVDSNESEEEEDDDDDDYEEEKEAEEEVAHKGDPSSSIVHAENDHKGNLASVGVKDVQQPKEGGVKSLRRRGMLKQVDKVNDKADKNQKRSKRTGTVTKVGSASKQTNKKGKVLTTDLKINLGRDVHPRGTNVGSARQATEEIMRTGAIGLWTADVGIIHGRDVHPRGTIKKEGLLITDLKINLGRDVHPRDINVGSGKQNSKHAYRVIGHGNKDLNLQRAAYLLMKGDGFCYGNFLARTWKGSGELPTENVLLQQKSPLRNTVLHIAASYGNNEVLDQIAHRQEAASILTAKNAKNDTALHVAAKAGHISTLKRLLAIYIRSLLRLYSANSSEALKEIPKKLLSFALSKNKQGNTLFHEALLNGHKGVMEFLLYDEAQFKTENEGNSSLEFEVGVRELVQRAAPFTTNNKQKSVLYLAVENGYKEFVDQALAKLIDHNPEVDKMIEKDKTLARLVPHNPKYVPKGKSPLLGAILEKKEDILDIMLKKKPEWIHLRDNEGRTPLHYAASVGYLEGVPYLIGRCASCTIERDKYGMFPLHLASYGGHDKVVRELVHHCTDATEMLDNDGRNILHIASESGKLNVVSYILQTDELETMINEKDAEGNTPLHLACLHCHPKIVHALTRARGVKLNLVNEENQTPLDTALHASLDNPTLRQRLTWIALKSAGAKPASPPLDSINMPPPSTQRYLKQKAQNTEQYKDRTNTLMLVSTLITTVTFAAGFTLPGGNNDSDPGQGIALMQNRSWFQLFIFCNTISMYSAVSVTIILIWAQLGDSLLAYYALEMAMPLLGVSLATLSLAFSAGVYLVVNELAWLAITLLIVGGIFTFVLLLVYSLLWFPSKSNFSVFGRFSYYPFRLLSWLAERSE